MSQSLLDSPAAAERIDDIIVTSLPLLFVHRHGSTFASRVASTICDTSLGKQHQLFSGVTKVLQVDRKLRRLHVS